MARKLLLASERAFHGGSSCGSFYTTLEGSSSQGGHTFSQEPQCEGRGAKRLMRFDTEQLFGILSHFTIPYSGNHLFLARKVCGTLFVMTKCGSEDFFPTQTISLQIYSAIFRLFPRTERIESFCEL